MSKLTIGRLAKRAGVNVETVRYYEREGLIDRPTRPVSGYREYPEATVRRVQFIRRAKELGFTLNEVAELLSLRLTGSTACDKVRDRALRKLQDVDSKIAQLQAIRDVLGDLVTACEADGASGECPILASLDGAQ